ncbi:MAG: glycosyltransferase involved in cell wall biosynthesis [Flavobacteriales bacterium]|jgi:glycosyltransferase involved in cell wall biosynthesis
MSDAFSNNTVLFIANVWPEPNSSAAGWRMKGLLEVFVSPDCNVHFACTAAKSDYAIDLEEMGIASHHININDSGFDTWLKGLGPNTVVFDRFMCEEQFGWRVKDNCPEALRILNTEDLHSLRQSREVAFKKKESWSANAMIENEVCKRELASILRSDLSLIISSFEMELLQKEFNVPAKLLHYLPFNCTLKPTEKPFEDRAHFVSIGNFKHQPNWQACRILKEHIWPLVRKVLPNAEVYLYGAYPDQKVLQLHDPKHGFIVKGRAGSAEKVIANARVLLAALPFGAGLKGKLLEAMLYGTPSITTTIGAEGMESPENWNGFVTDDWAQFAEHAVQLYQDKNIWEAAVSKGTTCLTSKFSDPSHLSNIPKKISEISDDLEAHRSREAMQQLLAYHSFRNNKFMSRWIELKN